MIKCNITCLGKAIGRGRGSIAHTSPFPSQGLVHTQAIYPKCLITADEYLG